MMIPLLFMGIIAADQIVKYCIRTGLMPGESLPIIPGFFKLTFVRNEGAAFSMFENNHWVTIGLALLMIAACIVLIWRECQKGDNRRLAICVTMVLAGGLSNLYDRIFMGYVTDMFSFGSFAVFNIADIFVVIGCVLAAIVVITDERFKN